MSKQEYRVVSTHNHHGGDQPVSDDVLVQVRRSNELYFNQSVEFARFHSWGRDHKNYIVEYQIVEPVESKQEYRVVSTHKNTGVTPEAALVSVRLRADGVGFRAARSPIDLNWTMTGAGADIVEYQIVEPVEVGWIEWAGGECPVAPETIVSVKLRTNVYPKSLSAGAFRWEHLNNNSDIVAYKVIKEHNANGWIEWAGGECPVSPDTIVSFKFRGDLEGSATCAAKTLRWAHLDSRSDIVAYKVIKEAPKQAPVAPEVGEDADAFWQALSDPTHPYHHLARVQVAAFAQAASGKGKERHASGATPFHHQPMATINHQLGSIDGFIYQAHKKSLEAKRLPDGRAQAEILGAINYLAGAVIALNTWAKRGDA